MKIRINANTERHGKSKDTVDLLNMISDGVINAEECLQELLQWLPQHVVDEFAHSYFSDGSQDYVNYISAVLEKLESVGCDVHDGEVIDYAESAAELIANDDDHDVERWWRDTQSDSMFMDEIDALPHI